jgi:hypothetical protein
MERSSPSGFFTDTHDLIRRTGSGETGMNLYVHTNHENRNIFDKIPLQGFSEAQRAGHFSVINPLPGCPLGGSGIHHARWNEWNNPVRFPWEMFNNQQNAQQVFLIFP